MYSIYSKKPSADRPDRRKCDDSNVDAAHYHKLPIDSVIILLVDNHDKFVDMLQRLSTEHMAAIDAEWKPISRSTTDVALIQISTSDCVYLIDVMMSNIDAPDWNLLVEKVFNNQQLIKIGNWQ